MSHYIYLKGMRYMTFKGAIITLTIGVLILIGGIATKKKWLMLLSIILMVYAAGRLAIFWIVISIRGRASISEMLALPL
jgi:hypothetical protein